jgi:hypothetical protein
MAKDSGTVFVPRMRPAHSRPRLAAIRSPEASAMLSAERRTQQWASLRGCGAIPLNGVRTLASRNGCSSSDALAQRPGDHSAYNCNSTSDDAFGPTE